MNSSSLLRRIQWKWALPILAVTCSAALMVLARRQDDAFWTAHPGISDTPWEFQAPARCIVQLLNGPGFYIPFFFNEWTSTYAEFARLPSIALFWTWLGWALDRRLKGNVSPLIKSRFFRAVSYTMLLVVACCFAWLFFHNLDIHQLLPSRILWREVRAFGLRASVVGIYVGLGWSVAYGLFFSLKLISTLASPESAHGSPRSNSRG